MCVRVCVCVCQLVDLFLASDWTIYITEYTTLPVQARKYNTVQPVQVHTLLTKYVRLCLYNYNVKCERGLFSCVNNFSLH